MKRSTSVILLLALTALVGFLAIYALRPAQDVAAPGSELLDGETPVLMCTPPACEEGEVFFCEGDCPGGCGTICVEPTPVLMCTPPACEEGEVFFCEGDCPGGCGTTCATPTP